MNAQSHGLLSEVAYPVDNGGFVIERKWNLHHPSCPMVPVRREGAEPADMLIEWKVPCLSGCRTQVLDVDAR